MALLQFYNPGAKKNSNKMLDKTAFIRQSLNSRHLELSAVKGDSCDLRSWEVLAAQKCGMQTLPAKSSEMTVIQRASTKKM